MIRLPGETFEDYSEEMTKEEEQELFDTAVKEVERCTISALSFNQWRQAPPRGIQGSRFYEDPLPSAAYWWHGF